MNYETGLALLFCAFFVAIPVLPRYGRRIVKELSRLPYARSPRAPEGTAQARRRVRFRNDLGAFDLTFPEGHTYAEDEDTIVLSHGKDSLTIHKADVTGLEVVATYGKEE